MEKALPRYAAYLATHRAPLTVQNYIYPIRAFLQDTNVSGKIRTQDIGDWLLQRKGNGISDNHMRFCFFALKSFFNWARAYTEWDIDIDWNLVPCPRVEWVESKALSKEELQLFFSHCTNMTTYTIALVLYDLALRVSELQSLKASDIDFETGEVDLGRKKRGRPLITHMAPGTMTALRDYMQRTGKKEKLFNISRWKVNKRLRKVAIVAGIITPNEKFGSHRFRHSRLTHLEQDGWSVPDLAKFARHKSLQSTMRYIKVSEEDIDAQKRVADTFLEEI